MLRLVDVLMCLRDALRLAMRYTKTYTKTIPITDSYWRPLRNVHASRGAFP